MLVCWLPDGGQTHLQKIQAQRNQNNATMRVRASSTAVLLLALVAVTLNRVGAYPIIAEIDEDDETVSHQERARMTKSKHHTSVSVALELVMFWVRVSDTWAAPLHMCNYELILTHIIILPFV